MIEKADQILHIVRLHFSTIEEATKFYNELPESAKKVTVRGNC